MYPAFIIHASCSQDREPYVKKLQEETDGRVVEAELLENRLIGCCLSHLKVARLAETLYPSSPYLVFEDDCVLTPDWKDSLDLSGDVVYLGYNDKASFGTLFGTHAMLITVKARNLLIQHLEKYMFEKTMFPAYDWVAYYIWKDYNLDVQYPEEGNRWAYQAKGLTSLITGHERV